MVEFVHYLYSYKMFTQLSLLWSSLSKNLYTNKFKSNFSYLLTYYYHITFNTVYLVIQNLRALLNIYFFLLEARTTKSHAAHWPAERLRHSR